MRDVTDPPCSEVTHPSSAGLNLTQQRPLADGLCHCRPLLPVRPKILEQLYKLDVHERKKTDFEAQNNLET